MWWNLERENNNNNNNDNKINNGQKDELFPLLQLSFMLKPRLFARTYIWYYSNKKKLEIGTVSEQSCLHALRGRIEPLPLIWQPNNDGQKLAKLKRKTLETIYRFPESHIFYIILFHFMRMSIEQTIIAEQLLGCPLAALSLFLSFSHFDSHFIHICSVYMYIRTFHQLQYFN